MREGAEPWVFYEGPPTANGRPGAHHVLSRVFKDIYPRYKTMRGHRVERKGGWDCHGLPVEIAVEQKLGINSKHEIENEVGIEEFNRQCRESVFEYLEEWNRLTERIGFWIDLDHAYRTLDETLHRVGVVGARGDPPAGAAVRGAQGGALLLPLRDGAVLARGGAGVSGRGRSVGVSCAAGASSRSATASGRCAADLDDHAMDAAGQRGGGGRAESSTCARVCSRRHSVLAEALVEKVSGRTRRSSIAFPARTHRHG